MRSAVIWLALAAVAGTLLGVAARVAMRVVALQADMSPGFSLGGSIEVIAFGMLIGTPVALIVWACRRRFQLPPGIGIIAGLTLFALFTVWQPPAATSALGATPDSPLATAVVFAAAFVLYGAALDGLWRLTQQRRDNTP